MKKDRAPLSNHLSSLFALIIKPRRAQARLGYLAVLATLPKRPDTVAVLLSARSCVLSRPNDGFVVARASRLKEPWQYTLLATFTRFCFEIASSLSMLR
jgi:hypothetical protein